MYCFIVPAYHTESESTRITYYIKIKEDSHYKLPMEQTLKHITKTLRYVHLLDKYFVNDSSNRRFKLVPVTMES